ncbi:winged helix-turn-helix domain-containing protein [Pseudomonas chlororaphis]|uniref:winged helix-turn-helix domain-containing protein n=1 Tax=Pseudomonas chlororaphis TaxID=587753 RepID=UPI0015E053ED|nr:winged helix-turn-helix domain-containing protein [Pseudomonas chlororaphis]QLL13483.1 winged helix-turn-helix domain-containing protein [Pseudomonas chlororaphis subsp. aurantiaca]
MVVFTIGVNRKATFLLESRKVEVFNDEGKSYPTYLSQPEARLLDLFLRTPGRTIRREELIEYAWAGRPVAAGSLNQAILNLRKALCYQGESKAIVTVPREGYKIITAILNQREDAPSLPESTSEPLTPRCLKESSLVKIIASRRALAWVIFILIFNASIAYFFYRFSSVGVEGIAVKEEYQFYQKLDDVEYYVAAPLVGRDERASQAIANLRKIPPKIPGKNFRVRAVYLNGAVGLRNFNYFICDSRLDERETNCFSYMLVLDWGKHEEDR